MAKPAANQRPETPRPKTRVVERASPPSEVLARHAHTAQPRGDPGGGAKDPTDDPAELDDVLF